MDFQPSNADRSGRHEIPFTRSGSREKSHGQLRPIDPSSSFPKATIGQPG
jgi:hypothetical protein